MESRRRSLAKALSWRFLALVITTGLAYLFTGRAEFALTIGVADSLIKIFVYYMHERAWLSVGFGRIKPPVPAVSRPGETAALPVREAPVALELS